MRRAAAVFALYVVGHRMWTCLSIVATKTLMIKVGIALSSAGTFRLTVVLPVT